MAHSEMQPAVDDILRMLSHADDDDRRLFPPTELYSEGWMLRLLLSAAERGVGCLPFRVAPDARWYSEARLTSPFLRRPNSSANHLSEGLTHADAIVGHFSFRADTESGIQLARDARQFVVVEAKMFSPLSRGTTNAGNYDQAARNVACMASLLQESERRPRDLDSLGFYVFAPAEQIEREASFRRLANRDSITLRVQERISEFKCDPGRHEDLERWLDQWFAPMMERLEVACIAWEDLVARFPDSAEECYAAIGAFYERCLRYNRGKGLRS